MRETWRNPASMSPAAAPENPDNCISPAPPVTPVTGMTGKTGTEIPVTAVTTVTKPPVRPREAVCAGSTAGPGDKPHTWKNRHIRRLWACTKTHHATGNRTGYRRREKTHLRVGPASRLSGRRLPPPPTKCQCGAPPHTPQPLRKVRLREAKSTKLFPFSHGI